jgi:predicted anti-sigma-YlaC factor YlaD
MNCAAIRDLILSEGEPAILNGHLRQCEECRAFWEASLELDTLLMRIPKAPAKLSRSVMAAIVPKPNYLPELLDFVGWAAMIAVMFGVIKGLLAT